jgi:hypothetical protein
MPVFEVIVVLIGMKVVVAVVVVGIEELRVAAINK